MVKMKRNELTRFIRFERRKSRINPIIYEWYRKMVQKLKDFMISKMRGMLNVISKYIQCSQNGHIQVALRRTCCATAPNANTIGELNVIC